MATYRKPHLKEAALKRLLSVVFITLCGVLLLIFLLGTNSTSSSISRHLDEVVDESSPFSEELSLPKQNHLSLQLEKRNQLAPRNLDLYPSLAEDRIIVVLYVHNRSQYLKVVVDSLSRVEGINETLLIVSHDGHFEDMNKMIESIRFCQVKQIFAPYSPHLFSNSFPGVSPTDCKDKDDETRKHCNGNPDQYGNLRLPKIVSLKHHWWWMMNTVWDGLKETKEHSDHILFIEEDHFIFPNAYRNIQILTKLKSKKCADCYAANLAPSDVNARGEGWDSLIAERMGNVGYSFNRTVWRKIHKKAREFCFFDDYNWDITMWATVYPSFGWSCLHIARVQIGIEDLDKVPNIKAEWDMHVYKHQPGYKAGFKGWGGWGDERDHRLCLNFANMYYSLNTDSPLKS
ncbi:Alpha-1,6-mannosyl-glycoprotein 2-beta-N-acetylglucosaminyltransferase [Quillaja saponaria]|uniref:Alpha-1,6-mannosyl-glycoprotein 2-beta-N-acetylglucosaminyltransferase n=1 Tax=Quillaja saponaria TaxID=32244 RepID=A0AAD7LL96_QUISA|nr:Alpha-1,6-mannosyl-glycoprotein 2-beta-N-acetylglucosaminyltransferase [Quillaja saponaria]